MIGDDDRDIDPEKPMSLGDALILATRLHRVGQLDAAHQLYGAVLEAVPELQGALQFLGILEHQRHNSELGLSYMQRALEQSPEAPGLHQNLGNVLFELRRFDDAEAAYERCAQLGGKSAELLTNIGALHATRRRHEAAEAAFREAVALNPEYPEAYQGYGMLLAQQGRHKEALVKYVEGLARDPSHAGSRRLVGLALSVLGRLDEAAQVYRDWIAAEPDDPRPRHYLAACTGEAVPERAPDAYVTATFDDFAHDFDSQLEGLQYRAPAHVGQAVQRLSGEPRAELDILDAGCGTGLCAPILAPFARRLAGVDLSGGMLAKARARGGYHELHKSELTEFLRAHARSFELIVSADTLCYFGDLAAVSRAAFEALRPGGHLVFTVEALLDAGASAAAGFRLAPFGRYCHGDAHVRDVLAAAGFEELALESVVLRQEAAEPVQGFLVSCRRPRG